MKATLEFNLPDDEDDFRTHAHARELACALWDTRMKIRDILKHGGPSDETRAALESLRALSDDAEEYI